MNLKRWLSVLALIAIVLPPVHSYAQPEQQPQASSSQTTQSNKPKATDKRQDAKPANAQSDKPEQRARYYTNKAGQRVLSPTKANAAPAGATAQCRDGSYSFSQSRRGTCSHHGGVASWLR